jgi:hypothetical protein
LFFCNCRTLTSLSSVTAYGFDLVRGTQTIDLIKSAGFPSGKYLFAGVVDGRNIWADDLAASLNTLQSLEAIVGKGKHSFIIPVIKIAGHEFMSWKQPLAEMQGKTVHKTQIGRTLSRTLHKQELRAPDCPF